MFLCFYFCQCCRSLNKVCSCLSLDRRNSRSKLRRRRRFFFPHRKKIGFFFAGVGEWGIFARGLGWMLSFSPLLLLLCNRGRENVFVRIPFFAIESRFDNFPNLLTLDWLQKHKSDLKKLNQMLSDVVTFNLGESLSTSTKAHVHSHRRPPPFFPPPSQNSIRTQHPSIHVLYCQCMGKRLISAPVCSPSSVILSLAQKGIEETECRTMLFLSSHYARCHLTRCCKKEGPSVPHVLLWTAGAEKMTFLVQYLFCVQCTKTKVTTPVNLQANFTRVKHYNSRCNCTFFVPPAYILPVLELGRERKPWSCFFPLSFSLSLSTSASASSSSSSAAAAAAASFLSR